VAGYHSTRPLTRDAATRIVLLLRARGVSSCCAGLAATRLWTRQWSSGSSRLPRGSRR
jgi:hypothetical protein